MPNYTGEGILLNREETAIFLNRITNPDHDILARRDAFLADIDRTLRVTQTGDGVYLEFSTDEHRCDTIIDTYRLPKNQLPVYAHYTMKRSDPILFEKITSDEKQKIIYNVNTENKTMNYELPLSA